MNIKAIIFDVDGTLADTEEAHRISFNKAFAENQFDWNWDVALYGKLLKITGGKERIKFFVETYRPEFKKPTNYDDFVKNLHQIKTQHYTTLLEQGKIPFRPNMKRLIAESRQLGLRLAIATTTTPENVSVLLKNGLGEQGTSMFEVIGCGDIVSQKKPAPDIYDWVLQKLNLKPAECIALEDSENGLRSSLAAGIKTFVTTTDYTRDQDFTGAIAMLPDLSDLEFFYRSAEISSPTKALAA